MSARAPRGRFDLFKLETPAITAAFWGAVGLFTLAFFVTPYLPLIDYHQHVALGAILHRLFDRAAPEHALYDVNLITYNGGFHLLVALLSYVLHPVDAGRVVMACFPFLLAAAALAVARQAGRPRWYACLALPITYSRGMAWGFANWNLTFPVALLAITWFLRYRRGERGMLPRLLLASCFCAYGHVLAMLCLCLGLGVVQLSRLRALGDSWPRRLASLAATPLPVLPGVLWCVAVYRYQTRASFSNWAEASLDGLDDPLWYKLRYLLEMSVGNAYDKSDVAVFALTLALCLAIATLGAPATAVGGTSSSANGATDGGSSESTTGGSNGSPRDALDHDALDLGAVRWLCLTFTACYLVIPKVFIATWFIYERFPTLAVVFLVGSLPLRLLPLADELRAAAAGLAVAAGANTLRLWATMGDAADAVAIMRDTPQGHRLLAVTYDPSADRISREVFVHLPGVYQANGPGEIAYTFTKFESMPVHYKPGKAPPSVPGGFEWDANKYDVNGAWARAYDLTLVRAPADVDDPASMVFRAEAWRVKRLARRGRFSLYDTSQLAVAPPTGPLPR